METARKITVEIPSELLAKAQEASGAGITETIRTGLRLVAASQTYSRLRQLRGKVRFSRRSAQLKDDRRLPLTRVHGLPFWKGSAGEDVKLLDLGLEDRQVVMVPVVLGELLSDPKIPPEVAKTLSEVPLMEVEFGYWQRAGMLRSKVLAKRRKARLGDALIAQSCIDGGVLLLSRDRDFRVFAGAAGLDLFLNS